MKIKKIKVTIIIEIFNRFRLQLAMNVHPIDSIANVLEYRLERHEKFAALHSGLLAVISRRVREEIDEAREHIRLGKIEECVENVNARLVELEKLVRIQFINFGTVSNFSERLKIKHAKLKIFSHCFKNSNP